MCRSCKGTTTTTTVVMIRLTLCCWKSEEFEFILSSFDHVGLRERGTSDMQLLEVLSLQLGTSSYPLQFTLKSFKSEFSLTSDINFWMKIYYVSKVNFTHIWYKFLDEKYILCYHNYVWKAQAPKLFMCTKSSSQILDSE